VLTVTNHLSTTVDASIRAGSSERWTVCPCKLRLKPKQSCEVELKLKVVKFAQVDKAVVQGQRDVFHIKTQLTDQQFHATFFLESSLGSSECQRRLADERPAELDPISGDDFSGSQRDAHRMEGALRGRIEGRGDWHDQVQVINSTEDFLSMHRVLQELSP
jgi:hypothetical protein